MWFIVFCNFIVLLLLLVNGLFKYLFIVFYLCLFVIFRILLCWCNLVIFLLIIVFVFFKLLCVIKIFNLFNFFNFLVLNECCILCFLCLKLNWLFFVDFLCFLYVFVWFLFGWDFNCFIMEFIIILFCCCKVFCKELLNKDIVLLFESCLLLVLFNKIFLDICMFGLEFVLLVVIIFLLCFNEW